MTIPLLDQIAASLASKDPAPQLRTALALTLAIADTRTEQDNTLCRWNWLSSTGSDTVKLEAACGGSGWYDRPEEPGLRVDRIEACPPNESGVHRPDLVRPPAVKNLRWGEQSRKMVRGFEEAFCSLL